MSRLVSRLPAPWLQHLAGDLRFAWRQLARAPLFSLTIILTFALGLATTASSFSVMDAIVLRPLATPQLDRVLSVGEQRGTEPPQALSYADYVDYVAGSHAFAGLAARAGSYVTLTRSAQSEHAQATRTTLNLFSVYQIRPLLGRTFLAHEDEPGRDAEAVLTHAFWQSHFGSRADALGQPLVLDGRTYTVVGVMPQSFDHVDLTDLWVPLALSPADRSDRTLRKYVVTGRLRDSATTAAAAGELNAIAAGIARQYPQSNRGWTVRVRPLIETINGDLTPRLMGISLAATWLLMIVVCVNISNLQFARTLRRGPEMAVRAALGSSRQRILSQLLLESLLLSLLGAAGGLLLARVALHYILLEMPSQVSRYVAGWNDIHLSPRTLAYSIAVAVIAGLIAGLAPALAGMRVNLLEQLKAGGRSVSGSARSHRLRNLFAGAQVMLATTLVAGAACIAVSMYTMLDAASRFDPAHALVLNTYLPAANYARPAQQAAFLRDSLDRLRTLPQVRSAEFTTALPYNNTGLWWQDLAIAGDPALPGQARTTQRLTVSPGYFQSFGIQLVEGRLLTTSDSLDSAKVAVISERLARMYFGSKDPLGHQIQLGRDANLTPPLQVVGVVADVLYLWVDQTPKPAVYLASTQFPTTSGTYVLRTGGDPLRLASSARQTLSALDSTVPVDPAETYTRFLSESLTGLSYMAAMLTVDALIALLLCALGIFGVMANLVTERTHEIGIRFALGANRAAVLGMLLRRSLVVTGVGLALGVGLAFEVAQLLNGALPGVQSLQAAILGMTALAVAALSVTAGYLPAHRAAMLDPVQALRVE